MKNKTSKKFFYLNSFFFFATGYYLIFPTDSGLTPVHVTCLILNAVAVYLNATRDECFADIKNFFLNISNKLNIHFTK